MLSDISGYMQILSETVHVMIKQQQKMAGNASIYVGNHFLLDFSFLRNKMSIFPEKRKLTFDYYVYVMLKFSELWMSITWKGL